MSRKSVWRSALLSTALGLSATGSALAKPPDLPVESGVQCPEARVISPEEAFFHYGVEFGGGPTQSEPPAAAPSLDSVSPCVLPFLMGRLYLQTFADLGTVPAPVTAQGRLAELTEIQAVDLLRQGERSRQDGDLDYARICYEEAHLLSPASRAGRLAVQRLQEMENGTGAAEEQEEPMPRTSGERQRLERRMRENTQPLGMVAAPSY